MRQMPDFLGSDGHRMEAFKALGDKASGFAKDTEELGFGQDADTQTFGIFGL
jgi:hypothetical protein